MRQKRGPKYKSLSTPSIVQNAALSESSRANISRVISGNGAPNKSALPRSFFECLRYQARRVVAVASNAAGAGDRRHAYCGWLNTFEAGG